MSGYPYLDTPSEVVHLVGGPMDTMPGHLSGGHTSYHHIWGCTPPIWSIWVLGRYHHIWHIMVPGGGYPQDAIWDIWWVVCQDTHIGTPHLRWYIWWVDHGYHATGHLSGGILTSLHLILTTGYPLLARVPSTTTVTGPPYPPQDVLYHTPGYT